MDKFLPFPFSLTQFFSHPTNLYCAPSKYQALG